MVVEMDPMTFEVIRDGGSERVEVMDPKTLFFDGNHAFEALDFRTAAKKYALVVARFPKDRYATVSAYNAGLSLEKLRRFQDAVPYFAAVVERTKGSKDAQDALFRMVACFEGDENWAEMEKTAERILVPHYPSIVLVDSISGLAQRGFARQKLGRLAQAERDYKAALALYRKNIDDRALHSSPSVALAQFQIAEIYRELFSSIQFHLPTDRMARDLDDKSNFFLMSQTGYLRALRLRHTDFSTIAGYRLGALYEVMYDDMMAAEIPDELNRDQVEQYYEELRERIRPLLVRAIDIYERNLRMGQRYGKASEDGWVRRTEAGLARLKEVLAQESSRDAAAEIRRHQAMP
ncbi:MAG: tetratricopeptide (TPR) repeat protein [Myxococcota bacterium]|jgi:tetratricopeptide (TPR) repeat protein